MNTDKMKRRFVKALNKDQKVRGSLVYAAIRKVCKETKESKMGHELSDLHLGCHCGGRVKPDKKE